MRGPSGVLKQGPAFRGVGWVELKSPGPQGPGAGGQIGCGDYLAESRGRLSRGDPSAEVERRWALVGPLCLLGALWGPFLRWVCGVGGPLAPPPQRQQRSSAKGPGFEQAPMGPEIRAARGG